MTGRSCLFNSLVNFLFLAASIVLKIKATAGLNPFMALLLYSNGTQEFTDCAGTLITQLHVLTSAQCITKHDFALFKVRLGEYDLEENPDCFGRGRRRYCQKLQDIEVEQVTYHEDYDPQTAANDIALIRLREKAKRRRNVRLIQLLASDTRKLNFEKSFMAGWGFIKPGLRHRTVRSKIVPYTEDISNCVTAYSNRTITNKQICITTRESQRTCIGYSGAPLIRRIPNGAQYRLVQVGILSFGDVDCTLKQPDVFTKVEAYIDWIDFHATEGYQPVI